VKFGRPDLHALPVRLRKEAGQARSRLHHGLRVLSGVEHVQLGPTPRQAVWRRGSMALYRYEGGTRSQHEPVLVVMSLVTKPTVFDLAPGMSFVELLLRDGFDVYLLDWGTPGAAEAANTIADYTTVYLPQVVREVHRHAGGPGVNIIGYCLGGTMALLTAAADTALPVSGIALVATPISFSEMGAIATIFRTGIVRIEDALDEDGNVPPATVARVIKLVKPTGDLTTVLSLWDTLPHRQLLAGHRTLMAWAGDHIPFPGTAALEFADLGLRRNMLASGEFLLGDRTVALSDVRCRVLNIYGTQDALVPPATHRMLKDLLPNADFEELAVQTGHAGLWVGSKSRKAMAAMSAWIQAGAPQGNSGAETV
jgi:polyhydroxyalkanoate synthase subunit PhaC